MIILLKRDLKLTISKVALLRNKVLYIRKYFINKKSLNYTSSTVRIKNLMETKKFLGLVSEKKYYRTRSGSLLVSALSSWPQ